MQEFAGDDASHFTGFGRECPALSSKIFRFGLFWADVGRNVLTRVGGRVKIQEPPILCPSAANQACSPVFFGNSEESQL